MRRYCFAAVVLSLSISNAQNPLPLQVGNMWEYRSTDPFDPYRLRMAVVGDTTLPNSHSYFVLAGSVFGSPFLRLDGSRVYATDYPDTVEFKLFDFLASPGDTISVLSGGMEVMIFRSTWFDSINHRRYWDFGLYRGVPPVMYEFAAWWIRDSMGAVYLRGEPGLSWSLVGARIAGDTIGILTSVDERDIDIPERPFLEQNYPNPFNPATTIEFVLPREDYVVVDILNVLGQNVERIFSGRAERGQTQIQWNASGRASGVYYVRLHTAEISQTRKLIVLR